MVYSSTPSFVKDPQAVLDFNWDWSAWLGEDEEISTSTVTPDPGLSVTQTSAKDGIVTAWLSGGAQGTDYTVACAITTSAGRADTRRLTISVRQR